MKKIRVLFLGSILDPEWKGGEPILAKNIFLLLKQHNLELKSAFYKRSKFWNNVSTFLNPLDIYLPAYIYYVNLIKKYKPDIVVCWYDFDSSHLAAVLKNKVPLLTAVHIYWPICKKLDLHNQHKYQNEDSNCFSAMIKEKQFGKYLSKFKIFDKIIKYSLNHRKYYINKSEGIITPSEYLKKILISHSINADIKVVYNGTDSSIFKNNYLNKIKNTVIYNGGADLKKGYLDYIKATRLLKVKYPQVDFLIGGGYSKRIPGDEHITYLGLLPQKKLSKYISKSICVVVPSKWDEPFGMVNTETMACKIPVVAYSSGGIPELIKNNFNGYLVQKGDVKNLSIKIEKLILEPRTAQKLGANGLKLFKKEFDIKISAKRYHDTIIHILDKRLRKSPKLIKPD